MGCFNPPANPLERVLEREGRTKQPTPTQQCPRADSRQGERVGSCFLHRPSIPTSTNARYSHALVYVQPSPHGCTFSRASKKKTNVTKERAVAIAAASVICTDIPIRGTAYIVHSPAKQSIALHRGLTTSATKRPAAAAGWVRVGEGGCTRSSAVTLLRWCCDGAEAAALSLLLARRESVAIAKHIHSIYT